MGEAYARCAREAGADLGRDGQAARAIENGFRSAMREAPPLAFGALPAEERGPAGRGWWREVARSALAGAGLEARVSFDEFFDRAYAWFARREAWRVPPDVVPGLRALRGAGVPLAVLSNWDRRLPAVLSALGLDGFFARILVSSDLPAAKPDPAAYHAAAALLESGAPMWRGAPLMVGDRMSHDVEPAVAAGWDAILLDRADTGLAVDGVERVTSITELAERIALAPASQP